MRQCTPAAKPLYASKAIVVNKRRAGTNARRYHFPYPPHHFPATRFEFVRKTQAANFNAFATFLPANLPKQHRHQSAGNDRPKHQRVSCLQKGIPHPPPNKSLPAANAAGLQNDKPLLQFRAEHHRSGHARHNGLPNRAKWKVSPFKSAPVKAASFSGSRLRNCRRNSSTRRAKACSDATSPTCSLSTYAQPGDYAGRSQG